MKAALVARLFVAWFAMSDIVTRLGLDDSDFNRRLDAVERREKKYRDDNERDWRKYGRTLGEVYDKHGREMAAQWLGAEQNLERSERSMARFEKSARRVGTEIGRAFRSADVLATASAGAFALGVGSVLQYEAAFKSTTQSVREMRSELGLLMRDIGRDLSGTTGGGSGLIRAARGARTRAVNETSDAFSYRKGGAEQVDQLLGETEAQELAFARILADGEQALIDRVAGGGVFGNSVESRKAAALLAARRDRATLANNASLSTGARRRGFEAVEQRYRDALTKIDLDQAALRRAGLSSLETVDLDVLRQLGDPFDVRDADASRAFDQTVSAARNNPNLTPADVRDVEAGARAVLEATRERIRLDREAAAEREREDRQREERRAESERRASADRARRVGEGVELLRIERMRADGQEEEAERAAVLLDYARTRRQIEEGVADAAQRAALLAEVGLLESAALSRIGRGQAAAFDVGSVGFSGALDASARRQVFGPASGAYGAGGVGSMDAVTRRFFQRMESAARTVDRIADGVERMADSGGAVYR